MKISRPNPDEYADYYGKYIAYVQTDDPLKELRKSKEKLMKFISKLSKKELKHRYAEGKWSIKEILVHLVDAERIWGYRALRVARNDKTPLPGWEENDYAPASKADDRKIKSILREFETVRNASVALFEGFEEEMLMRTGTASNHPISVRALAYVMMGHQLHHVSVIKERYLNPDYRVAEEDRR